MQLGFSERSNRSCALSAILGAVERALAAFALAGAAAVRSRDHDGESLVRMADREQVQTHYRKSKHMHMRVPLFAFPQRRCEGARHRAHNDIDSESLMRVTGRGRCSPHHMRSIHKRMCAHK
jgi:hypothetical protein